MDEAAAEPPDLAPEDAVDQSGAGKTRLKWTVLGVVLGVSALMLGAVWLSRERIADRIIASQLEKYRLPGTYTIDSVGVRHQVLRNVVIGDSAHPDFTAERVEVDIVPALGLPTVGRIRLVKGRLYGAYSNGRLTFGKLDSVLRQGSTGAGGLPDLDLSLDDARARIITPWGPVGVKAEGAGNLKSGFFGAVAAVAPRARFDQCEASQASLYGKVATSAGRPRFTGPLRLSRLACPGLALQDAGVQLDASADAALKAYSGKLGLSGGSLQLSGQRAAALSGSGQFTFKDGDLTNSFQLAAKDLDGSLRATSLTAEGMVRSHDRFASLESEGTLGGSNLRPGQTLDAALLAGERQLSATLAGPLIAKLRQGLAREGQGSRLSAAYVMRQTGSLTSLVLPRAVLRGGSGSDVLSLSRFQVAIGAQGGPHLSGNLATSGTDLPRLDGRIERQADGQVLARFSMPEYRAGDASLALQGLTLVISPQGTLGFSGRAVASGSLPGGRAEALRLPVEGNWSAARGLSALRRCTPFTFRSLSLYNLTLDSRSITLCPGPEGAILRSDARGVRFAAGAPSLQASGRLGVTPIRFTSGAIGFAVPGAVAAKGLRVELGPAGHASHFTLTNLTALVGQDVTGHFTGTDVKLDAVPLDLYAGDGDWRLAGGRLEIGKAAFRLEDRETDDRFRPLAARDARLSLINNRIVAEAELREPASDRAVASAHISHDLGSGRGSADLRVPGLVFDNRVQPDTLTRLALGVIANAKGTIAGTGRIDWDPERVTSTGSFSTDKLDFAAAFGPVEGLSGTVRFSDLLGLVTPPDQRLKLATINPGIEVYDGEVSFALQPGHVLQINGARWPFIDGTLELQPTRMVLGASEMRRYTLKVTGINSALFVERLQLGNLASTGYFDGEIPLVFDQDGGWVRGGLLVSRPPGGNLSYLGELTYKDLSAMGNFAFQTLRSLDYQRMQIGLDGALDGDIVTRLRIDGVRQGATAKKNILTRRLAGLPVRFNINIRAPFQRLVTSFKSLYDPTFIRDPRSLGLVNEHGEKLDLNAAAPSPADGKKPDIQPPDSRKRP